MCFRWPHANEGALPHVLQVFLKIRRNIAERHAAACTGAGWQHHRGKHSGDMIALEGTAVAGQKILRIDLPAVALLIQTDPMSGPGWSQHFVGARTLCTHHSCLLTACCSGASSWHLSPIFATRFCRPSTGRSESMASLEHGGAIGQSSERVAQSR